jgi:hypothetical protein
MSTTGDPAGRAAAARGLRALAGPRAVTREEVVERAVAAFRIVGLPVATGIRLRKASPLPEVALLPVELATSTASLSRALEPQTTGMIVAVADVEVRFAVGADVRYVAALIGELRSRC